MKQIIGLIGYPVKHSLSPYFQQAAFNYYNLNIDYQVWETEPNNLVQTVNRLRSPHFLGANVTTPYKEKVMELLDETDDLSSEVGAVNTIVKKNNKLSGLNTDAYGFSQSLKVDAGFKVEGKTAVILGAGGAAKAIIYTLIRQNISTITIYNRTNEKAILLMDYFTKYCRNNNMNIAIQYLPQQSRELRTSLGQCDIVINCTTMGMRYTENMNKSPLTAGMINPNALIYDLVYNPFETKLIKIAVKRGASTLNGLPMLIYQGAAAFELWTKRKAPLEIMFHAANTALTRIKENK